MPQYIPNESQAATYPNQAAIMGADFDNLVHARAGYAVLEGLAVTAGTGLSVSIAAGTVTLKEIWAVVAAASNQALTTANATNPRIDAVVVTSAGAIAIRTGTAAVLPNAPDLTTNDILLALVYVPANATTLTATNIRNKRVIIDPHGLAYLTNPTTNYTTTQTNTLVAAGLTIPANYLVAGNHFRIQAWGVTTTVFTPGTITVRCLYGATLLASTAAKALPASVTLRSFRVELDITVISTTAMEAQGMLQIDSGSTTAYLYTMGDSSGNGNVANITVDTTTAKALTLDFTLSAAQTAFRWRTFKIEAF